MNDIAVTFLLVGLIFVFCIAVLIARKDTEKKQEDGKKRRLQVLRNEILIKAEEYNKLLAEWREFYKKYEHLGKPTNYIGFSTYNGAPWEKPEIDVKFDDSTKDIDTLLKWACDGLDALAMKKAVLPQIYETAMFFQEERLAVIGFNEYKPEDLRFIKSRIDKDLGEVIVTFTTTNLACPVETMTFALEDRDTVDEFKACFNAFKALK